MIAIVATDAPLLPGQCKALARRVPLGLARTGTTGGHFSGDIFLAFSTANAGVFRTGFPGGEPSDADHDTLAVRAVDVDGLCSTRRSSSASRSRS